MVKIAIEKNLVKSLLYESQKEDVEVVFIFGNETVWASRKTVSKIFNTTAQNISRHFKKIVEEGELIENEVSIASNKLFKDVKEFSNSELQNSKKGGRPEQWYNLDAIISIGYRISTKEATKFRIWANSILKDYMIKGFVVDKELLINGGRFGEDYFDELLEIIREIRASERRSYLKITDLFAQTSYDYDKNSKLAKDFYAKVQNKLHFAVTGQTAAEIIYSRANHKKENMGLTTWNNGPHQKIYKKDIEIAKNYLKEDEIKELNKIVNMYLDYAENQAKKHKLMAMEDWCNKLDGFLEFNEYELLNDKGKISMAQAKVKADLEYEKFRVIQDKNYESDFEKFVKKLN